MILSIAKLILIFIALAFAVIAVSTVVWIIAALVRWFRGRRKRNG